MKRLITILLFVTSVNVLTGQSLNTDEIVIARDSFGVPHIFAPTHDGVAYGLAWAQCEDQFTTLQEIQAACRGVLGEIKGKDGVIADIGIQYMGIADFVNAQYDSQVSGEFKSYLESYVAGVNAYAASHPERVILKKLFPVSGQDIITGYLLGSTEISGAGRDLQRIISGRIDRDLPKNEDKGSNAFAISSDKTRDGKTYLAINSHQPLEGWYSWYEAHLQSEEGMDIIGGTFAGGVSIFLGANQHLGWAHTVNHADFSDVYLLEVNDDKTAYMVDGEWMPLIKRKARAKAKVLGFLKIPVSRTYYETIYGPAFETNEGFYAWSFMAGKTLKMAEQWWRMNLASNLNEFKDALEMRGIVSTNIVYADREDNIYYVSNGSIPKRDPKYDWSKVLPGNTMETKTSMNDLVPFEALPQVLNPECGWVFNTNNTPFTASFSNCSPVENDLNQVMGFQTSGKENNRSVRFLELMEGAEKLSYEDFKAVKYDNRYPSAFRKVRGMDVNVLMKMNSAEYPEVKDMLEIIQSWDRRTNVESVGASLFLSTIYAMHDVRGELMQREEQAYKGLLEAKQILLENFGTIQVPLAQIQKHSRGEISFPMAGGPDVLASIYSEKQKDGTLRAIGGESYIELVKFGSDGVEIESINAYGNSEVPGHPYSTSQMEYFAHQKLKKMTFNKEKILEEAIEIYHPQ
ncbi:penicillin acylase family protein [Portibacter marinus]|uniref:penicillin acylase family protein n=1 Tax=Portibacter marinus TaxID=2898660 RepID=UPI001F45733F|nr:penicillin acylase family protein [Portibacter marinus]